MKKRVLFYCAAVFATFSLQSCVTNYVVSAPTTYANEYKSNAKLASVDNKKLALAKDQLLNSFKNEQLATAKTLEAVAKNEEISKTIRFAKKIDDILTEAESYLGTPYRYGGMTRKGIDCSAFVLSVFGASAGMSLPRVAASQAQEGEKVDKSDLQKGDLVFFSHGKGRISHVGIVESVSEDGSVKFIHAATSKGVMISSLTDSYWGPKFRFAKRVLSQDSYNDNFANN
ncbi:MULTISPECIES: C40 family peptidase [unclassified Kaistella]|uniref:C40 family peptidase n=1 Tax=unclassified Kaistella TaxID=2762626 RepID=UPI00273753BE|nr:MULTISPECIES: NlpC/P60 family protein [unclassified Kaistella]MCZ2083677.1 NlpC/P60 family protein [Flavobacteriales bacterium]MDP2452886.1 NlpC/P60 family protein [Kaistella sp. SH11-4b]MDP2455795.1 NlpC/P60 family protein [Kaistella sp. SH40-3]MDP2458699.1 NlpC/P60 family protein [Kaistella sp. SH19-2b]